MANHAIMKPGVNQTKAQYDVLSANNEAKAGFFYQTSDADSDGNQLYGWGQTDGTIKWITYQGSEPVQGVADTDTIGLTLSAAGSITADAIISSDSDNIVTNSNGLKVPTLKVAANSTALLDYDASTNTIGMTALADKKKIVDQVSTDLATALTTHYPIGDELQVGDVIYLTAATDGTEIWVNIVGEGDTAAGDATDFIRWEGPSLTDDYIRGLISGAADVSYDPLTGVISLDVSAAPVTDTNNVVAGSAGGEVELQAILDAISGQPNYTFDLEGDAGDTSTIDIDETISINGGQLMKTTVTGNAVLVGFDVTAATAGQVVTVNSAGDGVEYADTQALLTFENGLVEAAGVVKLGGSLTGNTSLNMDGKSLAIFDQERDNYGILFNDGSTFVSMEIGKSLTFGAFAATGTGSKIVIDETTFKSTITGDTYIAGNADTSFTTGNVNTSNGADTTASYTGTLPFAVNDVVYAVVGGVVPDGYYTITSVTASEFTFDYVHTSVASAPSGVFTASTEGGNTFVDRSLYLDVLNSTRTPDFSPLVMADNATGRMGFAPYTLPSAVGAEGEVMKVDANGDVVFGVDTSDLTFQNGITADTGVVSLGGNLLEETTLVGGFDFILEGSDYRVKGSPTFIDHTVTASGAFNQIRIDASFASTYNFAVGENIQIPSGNPAGITPGIYAITAIGFQASGSGTEQTITLDNVQNNSEVNTSVDFTVQLVGALDGGNTYVGADLFVNADAPNSIENFRPAYMADTATGKIGFAPYALPNSTGTEGMILKVQNDGSLDWEIDASNLTADNGVNIDTGVIQLGGDLVENTTISTATFDMVIAGGFQTIATMSNPSYKVRHVSETNTTGVSQEFINGGYAMRVIDPANADTTLFNFVMSGAAGAIFNDARAAGTKTGIQYAGYDVNDWTNDTLVTKGYVDGLSVDANNGLTNNAGTIQLGGALLNATQIDLATFDFTFAGTTGTVKSAVDVEITDPAKGFIMTAPNSDRYRLQITNDGILSATQV